MRKGDSNNKSRLVNSISIIKFIYLFFCGIIIIKNFCNHMNILTICEKQYSNYISLVFTLLVVCYIYIFISALILKRLSLKMKYIFSFAQEIIFIGLLLFTMFFSGLYTNQYKFMYIFIIIIATIEAGFIRGIIISIISSLAILVIDIYFLGSLALYYYVENDLIMFFMFLLTAEVLGHYVKNEKAHINKLTNIENLDELTELYNSKYFHNLLDRVFKDTCKTDNELTLIIMDVDDFKNYIDLYGEKQGNTVLEAIGLIIRNNIRNGDLAARYGIRKFAIILPNTDEKEAVTVAENIREKVEKFKFQGEENQPLGRVTISAGVSFYTLKLLNHRSLIENAEYSLVRAKVFKQNNVGSSFSIFEEITAEAEENTYEVLTAFKTFINLINEKDNYTLEHCERVVMFSRLLEDKLSLNEKERKLLKYAAFLHDIGKINIPKYILTKKLPLREEEWHLMKKHITYSVEIIKTVKEFASVVPIVQYSHERYNGEGYPFGLNNTEIPYLARVLAVVESFDAMTSIRPYKCRMSIDEAIEEMKECSGIQFDPFIVDAFIQVIIENKVKINKIINQR